MRHTRIKICGITRVADALAVERAGGDAIGLVCWPGSRRFVAAGIAAKIVAAVSPMITTVGVFVDADIETVTRFARITGISAAQLCGTMPTGPWGQLAERVRLIRAVPVGPGPLNDQLTVHGIDDYLLDTAHAGAPGGTGETFDWSRTTPARAWGRLWLAGGLHCANVGEAIKAVNPYAVDLSTGVEESPGIKSHEKITDFVAAVREADSQTG
jgi:phosphoribosylanthranilate isomerase